MDFDACQSNDTFADTLKNSGDLRGAKMFQWLRFGVLSASVAALCCAHAQESSLAADIPEASDTRVTPSQYASLIDRVLGHFSAEVQRSQARVLVELHQKSSGTGAFTWRKEGGRVWEFHFYDGVLKIKHVNEDVLTLIICHELGHHLSGYPFKEDSAWSAAEGQADYFATQACVPRIWKDEVEKNSEFAQRVGQEWKRACDSVFEQQARRNLCYRTMVALEAARFYEGRNDKIPPDLRQRDATVVDQTISGHPQPQCRLDTQKAGALCALEFDFSKVPGLRFGTKNSAESEMESALSVCTGNEYPVSAQRPRCWFSPLVGGGL